MCPLRHYASQIAILFVVAAYARHYPEGAVIFCLGLAMSLFALRIHRATLSRLYFFSEAHWGWLIFAAAAAAAAVVAPVLYAVFWFQSVHSGTPCEPTGLYFSGLLCILFPVTAGGMALAKHYPLGDALLPGTNSEDPADTGVFAR